MEFKEMDKIRATQDLGCRARLKELDRLGDVSAAVALCESLSCCEDALCQQYLGWIYGQRGQFEDAVTWYLKAALQGSTEALEGAWSYVQMIANSGQIERAVQIVQTHPFCEYLPSQRFLAKTYHERGDWESTLLWSVKIADHGEPDDLLYVANMYLSRGEYVMATDYLKRAAAAGNDRAPQLLGEIYAFGLGVAKDEEVAMHYYEVGAKHGYLLSEVRLIHLERKRGGLLRQLSSLPRLLVLLTKIAIVKWRDADDPRVVDIGKSCRR